MLAVLLASAALEGGSQHSASHWLVVAGYGLCTALIAFGSTPRRDWIATCLDGLFAGYLLAEHVFVANDFTRSAAHTATLVPAFLLLLASGLALEPIRTAAFAALVVFPWAGAVAVAWTIGMAPSAALSAHLFSLASFVAASGFVLQGTARLRTAVRTSIRSERERAFLSRFVPPGTGPATGVRRRHACLLAIDIRGFSELSRRHAPDEVLSWLLQVRALVNAAIGEAGGSVDKYVGDAVLAQFFDGEPTRQATAALSAVLIIRARIEALNGGRAVRGLPEIRLVAVLHAGTLLAGILDDGFRAEMTVLGPAMNALGRIERRAKEEDLDLVASRRFVALLGSELPNSLLVRPLPSRDGDRETPELVALATSATVRTPSGMADMRSEAA
ncbi:adenylate/guanylate cyclase domain-containing protein [Enterovirga sp. CN4-39]|uniref:adenylate/guanylate cyclase domain-containing protein n=1 Tax=Enterovirga sp. CN4-39 TaxID=3400910 RepID=UPI003C033124